MTLSTLMARPCSIVRRSPSGETDDYGGDVMTETLVSTSCEIQQQSAEESEGGAITETLWDGFFPVATQLDAGDAVLTGNVQYEVIGTPWVADSGSAAVHHVKATLRQTIGVEGAS